MEYSTLHYGHVKPRNMVDAVTLTRTECNTGSSAIFTKIDVEETENVVYSTNKMLSDRKHSREIHSGYENNGKSKMASLYPTLSLFNR